jgi:hypothetical protein
MEIMTMMNRRVLSLIIIILFPLFVHAQTNDFGMWVGVSAEHAFSKKLEVQLSANIRSFKNSTQIDQDFIEGGLQYNLNKTISLAGSYRLVNTIENNMQYHTRQKFFFDLKAAVPTGNLTLTGRLRLQRSTRRYIVNADDLEAKYTGRIKVKADYDFGAFPLDPFIYAEGFFPIIKNNGIEITKSRLSAGTNLKISRKSSVSAEYIFQKDTQPDQVNTDIISVNYSLKF